MDFGLGFMFDAGPYGFSVLIAGARLGVRFELHLITQWGPPKRDPWKPHISLFFVGPIKRGPQTELLQRPRAGAPISRKLQHSRVWRCSRALARPNVGVHFGPPSFAL